MTTYEVKGQKFESSLSEAQVRDALRRKGGDFAGSLFAVRIWTEKQEAWAHKIALEVLNPPAKKVERGIDLGTLTDWLRDRVLPGKNSVAFCDEMHQEVIITAAKPDSKNPGAFYVRSEDNRYLGKITANGYWRSVEPESTADHVVGAILAKANEDPLAAVISYGRRTSRCSFCGRSLENERSVELGYGPICASNMGLPY